MLRTFEIGDVCVHKGFICRVDASERCVVGVNFPSCFSIRDGTELNPTLTLTPLYGPDGEPVKKAKPRTANSGAAEYAQDALKDMRDQVALLQKKIALLEGLTPPSKG